MNKCKSKTKDKSSKSKDMEEDVDSNSDSLGYRCFGVGSYELVFEFHGLV